MARRKKTETTPPPAAGHNSSNGLTDDQNQKLFLDWLNNIKTLKSALQSANSDLRNAYKKAKAEGFAKKDFDFALELESQEDEASIEKRHRQTMIARWLCHPIGTQADMFEDRTPDADKAYAQGKRAGMEGATLAPPYDLSTEQGQRWISGWHDGQAVNIAGIKALRADPEDDGSVLFGGGEDFVDPDMPQAPALSA